MMGPRRIRSRVIVAASLAACAAAGCPQSETVPPPVTATKPEEPPGPGPVDVEAAPPEPFAVVVRIYSLADLQPGWLRIEALRESAAGAWAIGSFIADKNKIVIDTEDVEQFSIHLSELPIDWDRRVILRIDGRSTELTPKRRPIVHLRRSPAGSWDVVEP